MIRIKAKKSKRREESVSDSFSVRCKCQDKAAKTTSLGQEKKSGRGLQDHLQIQSRLGEDGRVDISPFLSYYSC